MKKKASAEFRLLATSPVLSYIHSSSNLRVVRSILARKNTESGYNVLSRISHRTTEKRISPYISCLTIASLARFSPLCHIRAIEEVAFSSRLFTSRSPRTITSCSLRVLFPRSRSVLSLSLSRYPTARKIYANSSVPYADSLVFYTK